MNDITYSTERLESGPRKWAVTRNGEVIKRHRLHESAVSEANYLGEILALLGSESTIVELYLSRPIEAR